MSENKHQHGKMNIKDQEETFKRFISFGLYLFYASIAAIIFWLFLIPNKINTNLFDFSFLLIF